MVHLVCVARRIDLVAIRQAYPPPSTCALYSLAAGPRTTAWKIARPILSRGNLSRWSRGGGGRSRPSPSFVIFTHGTIYDGTKWGRLFIDARSSSDELASSFRRALVRFAVDSEWGRAVFSFDFTDSLHEMHCPPSFVSRNCNCKRRALEGKALEGNIGRSSA